MIFVNGNSVAPTIAVGEAVGTLDINANGVYDVTNYSKANVKLSTQRIPEGYYQIPSFYNHGYNFTGSISSFQTRLYEIVEIADNYIQCSASAISSLTIQNAQVGYLNKSKQFISIGNGSRTSYSITATVNGYAPYNAITIVKDLSTGTLYIAARYSASYPSVTLTTTAAEGDYGYCRELTRNFDISNLPNETVGIESLRTSLSSGSIYPALIFTESGIESDSYNTLGFVTK